MGRNCRRSLRLNGAALTGSAEILFLHLLEDVPVVIEPRFVSAEMGELNPSKARFHQPAALREPLIGKARESTSTTRFAAIVRRFNGAALRERGNTDKNPTNAERTCLNGAALWDQRKYVGRADRRRSATAFRTEPLIALRRARNCSAADGRCPVQHRTEPLIDQRRGNCAQHAPQSPFSSERSRAFVSAEIGFSLRDNQRPNSFQRSRAFCERGNQQS